MFVYMPCTYMHVYILQLYICYALILCTVALPVIGYITVWVNGQTVVCVADYIAVNIAGHIVVGVTGSIVNFVGHIIAIPQATLLYLSHEILLIFQATLLLYHRLHCCICCIKYC